MFKTVIAKARLKKEEFKTIDKQMFTYNKQHINLDRRVDTGINFKFTLLFMWRWRCPIHYYCLKQCVDNWKSFNITQVSNHWMYVDKKSETAKQTQRKRVRIIQTIWLLVQHIAAIPVKVDGNEDTLLLESNPRLVDLLCIEDSVWEANQEGTSMVVVFNSSKISYVLKSEENRDNSWSKCSKFSQDECKLTSSDGVFHWAWLCRWKLQQSCTW